MEGLPVAAVAELVIVSNNRCLGIAALPACAPLPMSKVATHGLFYRGGRGVVSVHVDMTHRCVRACLVLRDTLCRV